MDQRFITGFERQVNFLAQREPFKWILELVRDEASRILPPLKLREDGALFLIGNIGALIVGAWDIVEGPGNFRSSHSGQLRDDVGTILRDARGLAVAANVTEISARLLLVTTAWRELAPQTLQFLQSRPPQTPLSTLGLGIWGP